MYLATVKLKPLASNKSQLVLCVKQSASDRLNALWMPSRLCKESAKDFLCFSNELGVLF